MGIHLRAIRVSRDLNINTPVPQRLADELSKLIPEKVLQTYQGLVVKKIGKRHDCACALFKSSEKKDMIENCSVESCKTCTERISGRLRPKWTACIKCYDAFPVLLLLF